MRITLVPALALGAAVLALTSGGLSHGQSSGPVAPAAEPQPSELTQRLEAARRGHLGRMQGDLFAAPKAAPAPKPAKPAPLVVAPPAPPAFPYRYGGRVDDGSGAPRIFFVNGNDLVEVKPGRMLDSVWRVDVLSAERVQVSFVPSGQQLSMSLESLTPGAASTPGLASHGAAVAAAASPATFHGSERSLSAVGLAVPTQPATSDAPGAQPVLMGALMGVPPAAQPARAGIKATTTAPGISSQSAAAPSTVGPGTASPAAVPAGRLGVDAPATGSMPTGPAQPGSSMPIGSAPSGSMPMGPVPTGRLGVER